MSPQAVWGGGDRRPGRRARTTEEIPDDIGYCPRCRFYVERGHVCDDIASGDVWPPADPLELEQLESLPYDPARDGPF